MKNTTNPFSDPIDKLEEIEFKIRCASQVFLDLSNEENHVDPLSLDYMACALHDHAQEFAKIYEDILYAWKVTKSIIEV